jgi:Fungal specific transcription factor domain
VRKSIICSGYRNVSLLLFKDESESTARKVQWERNGVLYPPITPEQKFEGEFLGALDCNPSNIIPSPSYALTPSHDELALGYFMLCYVSGSPFNYLPEIYNTTALPAQDTVTPAILAVSFASLSLRLGSDKLMNYGRIEYSKALTRTNAALASPDTAILDSSLLSVLLLGFY